MVQRDELEIILEVLSFGMLGSSTFLSQATRASSNRPPPRRGAAVVVDL